MKKSSTSTNRCALSDFRLVVPDPEQLGQGVDRVDGHPGAPEEALTAEARPQPRFRARACPCPGWWDAAGGPNRSTGVMASPWTDRPIAATSDHPGRRDCVAGGLHRQGPDPLDVLLSPGRPGQVNGVLTAGAGQQRAVVTKRTALQPVVPTSSPRSCPKATPQPRWSSACRYITSMRSGETSGWMLWAGQKT